MKCRYCSYTTSLKSSMITHIRSNHRAKVVSSMSPSSQSSNDSLISDMMLLSVIENSFSSFTDDRSSFSGSGGSFDGGGASGSYDSGSSSSDCGSSSSDSGSCGGCD